MSEQTQKKRKLGWVLIPPYILARPDLSDSEKIIYGKIKGLLSDRGYCFATNTYLAENVLKSPSRISKVVSALADKGLIKVQLIFTPQKEVKERRIYIMDSEKSAYHEPDDNYTPMVTDDQTSSHIQLIENRESIEKETPISAEVNEVWEYYLAVSKQKPLKTPARLAKIKTRLLRFEVADLKIAIDKCFAPGSFYTGNNDRGWKADVDYMFRTDEIVDRLRNLEAKRERLAPGEYDINVPGVGSFKKTVDAAGVTRVLSFYQYRLNQVEAGVLPESALPDKKLEALEQKEADGTIKGTEKLELDDLRVSVPKMMQAHADWREGKYDNI